MELRADLKGCTYFSVTFVLTGLKDAEQSHCTPSWSSEGDLKPLSIFFQSTGIYSIVSQAIVYNPRNFRLPG
jgi:hypothetical protein